MGEGRHVLVGGSVELLGALKEGDSNNENIFDNGGVELLDKLASGFGGATCGDEVVDDEDARVGGEGIVLHFKDILAVLLLVDGLNTGAGELACLSDRDKGTAQPLGEDGAE